MFLFLSCSPESSRLLAEVLRAYSAKIYDNFAESFKVLTPMWIIQNAGLAVLAGLAHNPFSVTVSLWAVQVCTFYGI